MGAGEGQMWAVGCSKGPRDSCDMETPGEGAGGHWEVDMCVCGAMWSTKNVLCIPVFLCPAFLPPLGFLTLSPLTLFLFLSPGPSVGLFNCNLGSASSRAGVCGVPWELRSEVSFPSSPRVWVQYLCGQWEAVLPPGPEPGCPAGRWASWGDSGHRCWFRPPVQHQLLP